MFYYPNVSLISNITNPNSCPMVQAMSLAPKMKLWKIFSLYALWAEGHFCDDQLRAKTFDAQSCQEYPL